MEQPLKTCLREDDRGSGAGAAAPGPQNRDRDSQCLDLVLERLQTELDALRVHGFRTLPTPSASGGSNGGVGGGVSGAGNWADDSDLMENIAELDQLLEQPGGPGAPAAAGSDEESPSTAALMERMSPPPQETGASAMTQKQQGPPGRQQSPEADSRSSSEPAEENGGASSDGGLKRGTKFRWSSFARSHRPNVDQRELQISGMSVTQLSILRTAACSEINKIVQQNCPPNKPLFTWGHQKPTKSPKSAGATFRGVGGAQPKSAVFGMPLATVQMRCGQPLPSSIVQLMRQLRQSGVCAHGIFRRAGGKARVSALRAAIDADPDKADFSQCQPYDLADLVKTYLRELPECLMTHKLSLTLMAVFVHVEAEATRLAAVQAAALLLPDENRQVLQALLYFLNDFADCSETTQMTPSNLAVCLAPSLFYFPHQASGSPLGGRFRRQGAGGAPDPQDLEDHMAAAKCLAFMIDFCHRMFTVPDELYKQLASAKSEELEAPSLDSLAPMDAAKQRHCFAFADNHAQRVARECCHDQVGGGGGGGGKWTPFSHCSGIETFFKVVDDDHPLRLWKAIVMIEADSTAVLNRIVAEREKWDPDVLKLEVVQSLDDASDVVRLSLSSPPAQPSREACLLRAWRSPSAHSHAVYSTSVRVPASPMTVQALLLVEDWSVQAWGPQGSCRVTLLSRADLRGHSPEWYRATWGHAVARRLSHLKKSFLHHA